MKLSTRDNKHFKEVFIMKFKKLISLFLAGVMALSMAACGDQNKVAGTDLGDKLGCYAVPLLFL